MLSLAAAEDTSGGLQLRHTAHFSAEELARALCNPAQVLQ